MSVIQIKKLNESTVTVTSDDIGIEQELNDFFTFDIPGAKFMPAYKAKLFDGKARLFNLYKKTLPYGLYEYVLKFAEERNYEVESHIHHDRDIVTYEEIESFCNSLQPHSNGKKLEIRDYQIQAVFQAISRGRLLALSPTSSGKSLILYCYVRWHLEKNRRIILMVPTTSLVTQMFSDFSDYSTENGWSADENCHMLYSGQIKQFDKPVLITTWQSIDAFSRKKTKEVADFYKSWDVYIGDEAHKFASNSILGISNKLLHAKYRLGTTGTLQDAKVFKLSLEGSFGPVYKVITTKELMDRGQVVQLNIKCLVLDYAEDIKKAFKKVDYQTELDYLVTNEKRNKFIAKLAKVSNGNTLVLFNFVQKHGKPLYELIKTMVGDDRPVFYISGEVSADERENIRKTLETHTDAILVASYATLSTGVNIPSIENIIFASPSKSKIRNLQSIGRGLRLRQGKNSCTLFDIADNLTYKSKMNYSMIHFKERIDQYKQESFDFTIKQIPFL